MSSLGSTQMVQPRRSLNRILYDCASLRRPSLAELSADRELLLIHVSEDARIPSEAELVRSSALPVLVVVADEIETERLLERSGLSHVHAISDPDGRLQPLFDSSERSTTLLPTALIHAGRVVRRQTLRTRSERAIPA